MLGLQAKLIIFLILAGGGASGWFYVKNLQSELEAAKIRESKLNEAIEARDQAMTSMRQDLARMGRAQEQLNTQLAEANRGVIDLQKKFNTKNLSAAAQAKPAEMESKINRGTVSALRCNEIITGIPLTEDESAGKVKNTICPELFPKAQEPAKK